MDRAWAHAVGEVGRSRSVTTQVPDPAWPSASTATGAREPARAPGEALVLPSRRHALDTCRSALETGLGPVLIAGEPGIGKTWLARTLADETTDALRLRWAAIDLSPGLEPVELHERIGLALGLVPTTERPAAVRTAAADWLADQAADGHRWALIVDEAQNLAPALGEELRVLANRLGRTDGFAAIIVIGQTELARRLRTQPFAALGDRLAGRVHLRPIDADEAELFLTCTLPDRSWPLARIERLHRDAAGNPMRLLRLALAADRCGEQHPTVPSQTRPVSAAPGSPRRARPENTPGSPLEVEPGPVAGPPPEVEPSPSLLGEARPPLWFSDDGLIEVGWEPEPDAAPATVTDPTERPATSDAPRTPSPSSEPPNRGHEPPDAEAAASLVNDPDKGTPPTEQTIDDHYATLQAWHEWVRNQDRDASQIPEATADDRDPDRIEPDEASDAEPATLTDLAPFGRAQIHPNIWVEGQQQFAPYSQLFSRIRQRKDGE